MKRIVAATLTAGALMFAACSSGTSHTPAPSSNPDSAAAPAVDPALAGKVAAARWWSAGDGYCAMLKETLAAGHSILTGATANDPTLHAVTTQFVTDLQRAAPDALAQSWQVLGNLIITLVQANGNPSAVQGVDSAKVKAAVTTVSSDAQSRCGVSLSTAH